MSGRIETTIGPWKRPADRHAMFVRYMGTFTPSSMCRTGTPALSKAFSNVKEQPITKETKSSRQVRVYEVCLQEESECEPLIACLENAQPQP